MKQQERESKETFLCLCEYAAETQAYSSLLSLPHEDSNGALSDGVIQAGSAAFDALMSAITNCQSTLTVKIDHVQTEMALIC